MYLQQINDLENLLIKLMDYGYKHYDIIKSPTLKLFKGSEDIAYFYEDKEATGYTHKVKPVWSYNYPPKLDDLYNELSKATVQLPNIKVVRLTKKANGIRIRFEKPMHGNAHCAEAIWKGQITKCICNIKEQTNMSDPVINPASGLTALNTYGKDETNKEKEKEEMKDFSLSNLKDAVINKVTSLDKKTVTILAIIALLLLIVGKYQTIKDILIGIKDKVKRSKNFKAMVEDGTNALNSLKKLVGVKEVKAAKNDEA